MANDCTTKYYFEGPKQDILAFAQKLIDWTSVYNEKLRKIYIHNRKRLKLKPITPEECPYLKNSFNNILFNANLTRKNTLRYYDGITDCNAHALVQILDDDHPILYVETITTWNEYNFIWYKILETYFPKIRFYYYAEEYGSHYFKTNDIFKKFFNIDYRIGIDTIYENLYSQEIKDKYKCFRYYKDQEISDFKLRFLLNLVFQKPINSLGPFLEQIDKECRIRHGKYLHITKIKKEVYEVDTRHVFKEPHNSKNMSRKQSLTKTFQIRDKQSNTYKIDIHASQKPRAFGIIFLGKIFYNDKYIVKHFEGKSNANFSKTNHLYTYSKRIASNIEQQFYKYFLPQTSFAKDKSTISSSIIIGDLFISLSQKKYFDKTSLNTPCFKINILMKSLFASRSKSNGEYFKLIIKNIYFYPDKKSVYHLITLLIYSLIHNPDNDLNKLIIQEQNFLN